MKDFQVKKEDLEYTYEKWIAGKPEPEFKFWGALYKGKGVNPEYEKIIEAKNYAFDNSLELTLNRKNNYLLNFNKNLDLSEKIDFTNAELEEAKKLYSQFKIQDILQNSHPEKLKSITSKKYLDVKKQKEGIESGKFIGVSGVILNDFHTAIINYKYSKFCNKLLSEEFKPDYSEILENSPHKLCLLDELGFIEILEERFKDKNYFGKARETDKAKILASLFSFNDPEYIRQSLKNKDYINKKQKKNIKTTLNNHGLKPTKFID
ncbi:hypothetical protein [Algoriphagus persicinus]|uniref:hypothetical protein n=1 Tax=Algoriphagus persicinus TaxID=3108754 RepID=UPI002B366304|nr:hypothetical protein [Algoriphagus sp. E1-3-M2]MEB2787334.1 hypothetical protein [Algoriphagus sp. E1-3-M2]